MKTTLPQPTEHQIQTDIIQYLRRNGFYCQRMNSGRVPVINKYGQKHMMQLNEAGTPDILAIKKGKCIFVEVKRNAKMLPTRLQVFKMKELEEYGAKCYLAYSVDNLKIQLSRN